MERKIETKSIEEMKRFLSQCGFNTKYGFDTPLLYDAQFGRIEGNQRGFDPNLTAIDIAILTIQKNGSAPKDYQSVSKHPIFDTVLYVCSYQSLDNGLLIVSDLVDREKNEALRPVKLELCDLIGYESLRYLNE